MSYYTIVTPTRIRFQSSTCDARSHLFKSLHPVEVEIAAVVAMDPFEDPQGTRAKAHNKCSNHGPWAIGSPDAPRLSKAKTYEPINLNPARVLRIVYFPSYVDVSNQSNSHFDILVLAGHSNERLSAFSERYCARTDFLIRCDRSK